MTGRWSRTAARERWTELGTFVGRPLATGLAVVGLWPPIALAADWSRYERPLVASAVYIASVAIVAVLWWSGRRGIGLGTSVAAGLAIGALNVALTLQVPAGEFFGVALWLHSWGAAVPMLLAFARPVEEPIAILGLLTVTNIVAVARADQDIEALHNAPLHVGLALSVAASGLVLVVALRSSVATARRSRQQTDALVQRERVAATVEREQTVRFAHWEEQIAPLLEDLAGGRRSVDDPSVGARCRALAGAVRAELNAERESMLVSLVTVPTGVDLVIRDLDVGHRLLEADRIALVRLMQRTCGTADTGSVQLTLLPDGEDLARAIAVLAGDGVPQPDVDGGGTLVVESPLRWWYDMSLRCEVAPAIAARSHQHQVIDR